jgi:NAD(P)-dependent dehydrogenase (short-subunit alcohol dehydrogenase family)
MSISIDLSGRVILVCGASRRGISGSTVRKVAAAGAAVAMVDIDQGALDKATADIEAAGGRCHPICADLTDTAQADRIVPAVLERFGRLDGAANVAGGTRADEWTPLEQTPTEGFRQTLNLNLEYVFRICRDAAAAMIQRDMPGSFVNVASVSALASAPFHGPYGAAKSGMMAITRTMAFEWAKYGIRANTVSPGGVLSDRVLRGQNEAEIREGSKAADIVFTEADELANAIVFLLSDLASGVSGQNLVVDSALSTKFCAGMNRLEAVKRSPQG